jgi:MSHA biogenesis protein MshO
MKRLMKRSMQARGFTLVELVMVIVITGILAASIAVFFRPAIDSYFDTRRRADLTDIADTALRRMGQDIRRAVPNSVRSVSATCFQLAPTTTGGRYRMASDTVNDSPPLPCVPSATCSAPLDTSAATTVFDVLSPLAAVPAANDWVVINNQNAGDVYAGTNRGQITAVATPRASDGLHRITIGSKQFPSGYDGGRFVVVADAEQSVFYSCVGGVLYRTVAAFGANQATTCGLTTGAIVATDVAGCTFVHDPNQGATQQSGFVWMRLELSRAGESVTLAHGVHVSNVP